MAHPSGEYPRAIQEQILSSVGVDQEVARFEVTLNDTDGPNVLETAKGPTNEAENEGRRVATGIGSRWRAPGDWWMSRDESALRQRADRPPSAPPKMLKGNIRRWSEVKMRRETNLAGISTWFKDRITS